MLTLFILFNFADPKDGCTPTQINPKVSTHNVVTFCYCSSFPIAFWGQQQRRRRRRKRGNPWNCSIKGFGHNLRPTLSYHYHPEEKKKRLFFFFLCFLTFFSIFLRAKGSFTLMMPKIPSLQRWVCLGSKKRESPLESLSFVLYFIHLMEWLMFFF